MRKMKRVEDSRTENTYLIMNKHINSYGRLFGGVLMQWTDEMAGIVAHRRAYEVMVALDENDNKVEVPGLIVETEAEKAEWQGAEKRYALRKKRRIEGF